MKLLGPKFPHMKVVASIPQSKQTAIIELPPPPLRGSLFVRTERLLVDNVFEQVILRLSRQAELDVASAPALKKVVDVSVSQAMSGDLSQIHD